MDVQPAVDAATMLLQESKNRFERAAERLLSSSEKKQIADTDLSNWIEGCKYNCVGNLSWRLAYLFQQPIAFLLTWIKLCYGKVWYVRIPPGGRRAVIRAIINMEMTQ